MHPFYGPSSQLLQGDSAWWLGLASMAMYLIFWAIVILFAVRFFKKYFIGKENHKGAEDEAMAILRCRYAKGEIDAEEFRRKKADLE